MASTVMRAIERILCRAKRNEPPLYVGDWVEVRSKEDILRTLDRNGQLDGMPFMPEMFAFCGMRLRIYKRAHKTCDTVYEYKGRRLEDAVHLEGARCDGESHGGCEAGCLIFWKTAWLRLLGPSDADSRAPQGRARQGPNDGVQECTEADIVVGTRRGVAGENGPVYVCQATQIPYATEPLRWWEGRQYVEDFASGNVGFGRMAKTCAYMAYRHGLVNLGVGLGPSLKWLYDRFQSVRGGIPYPNRTGTLPAGGGTPTAALDLQPGEWVRVKSFEAIRATCDTSNRNRGMTFDPEMVPYCGGSYRVLKRVTKILNERTGKMQSMKSSCIILDSVVCQARYSDCRPFCPRSVYPFWREIWLERIGPPTANSDPTELDQGTGA